MAYSGSVLCLIREEIKKLLNTFERSANLDYELNMVQLFVDANQFINNDNNLETNDANRILGPFLKVIRSQQTNDVISEMALEAIGKFLIAGVIDPNHETLAGTVNEIADAVSEFMQINRTSNANFAAIKVVQTLIESTAGNALFDDSVCRLIINWSKICSNPHKPEVRQGYATETLEKIVWMLFNRLSIFSTVETVKKQKNTYPLPYGLPCIQELLKFFIYLCKAPLKKENIIQIQMGLSLLTVAFEGGAQNIARFSTLLEMVKHKVCTHFLQLMNSGNVLIFPFVMKASFFLFKTLRDHLKFQLEAYLKKLCEIITSDNLKTSNKLRGYALFNLQQLFQITGFVADIYINYDCDLYCSDLLENITKSVSKGLLSVTNISFEQLTPTYLHSIGIFISIINIIDSNCVTAKNARKFDVVPRENIATAAINAKPKFMNNFTHIRVHSRSQQISHEQLIDLKNIKKIVSKGTELFNQLPEKGIQYLQENEILNSPLDSKEVVLFLRENPGLDKKKIGEFIRKKDNSELNILQSFVKSFKFTGLTIDQALRLYVETFWLPGETELMLLLLEHFGDHWHRENYKPFANTDAAVQLAYGIIMLNMDLHGSIVNDSNVKMTLDDFLKNLRGLNGGANFNQKMLTKMFNSIKNKPIAMSAEETGIIRDNNSWKMHCRRAAGPDSVFNHVNDSVYDKEIFHIISKETRNVLGFIFEKITEQEFQHQLEGLTKYASIAAFYNLHEDLDAVMLNLCQFTSLLQMQPNSSKNIAVNLNRKSHIAIEKVFTLLHDYAAYLQGSWEYVFEVAIQLLRLEFVSQFKKVHLEQLVTYSSCAQNGFVFLETFIDFLSTSHRVRSFIAELELNDFGGTNLTKSGKELQLIDTIRQAISAYAKPVGIEVRNADNRLCIDVIGKNIMISEVLQPLEKKLSEDYSIEEVRFISEDIIHIDAELKRKLWHGKNVVICTKNVKIHGKNIWDVSGEDNDQVHPGNAGTGDDGHGKQGKDGNAGESGGNVLILAEEIENLDNITILSNGGRGGRGQDGGNGKNGVDGNGITKSELEDKFPSPVKFFNYPARATIKAIIINNIKNESSRINSELLRENDVFIDAITNNGNRIIFSYSGNVLFHRNFQAYFFYAGSLGKPGGNGGEYGLGGSGGYAGEITVRNLKNGQEFNIIKCTKQGEDGQNGKGGFYGNHGKNGYDMGYLDYQLWKVPVFTNEMRKYVIKYYDCDDNSSSRVWCAFKKKYVAFESVDIERHTHVRERMGLRVNCDRQQNAEAARKKNISQNFILTDYKHHFSFDAKSALHNLRSNFESIIQQASIKDQELQNLKSEQSGTNQKVQSTSNENNTQELERSCNTEVRIKRTVSHRNKKTIYFNSFTATPTFSYKYIETVSFDDLISEDITTSITQYIDKWFQLKNIELNLTQLNQSLSVLEILNDKFHDFEKLLINKYRFFSLHKIAKQLTSHEFTDTNRELTPERAAMYLIEAKTNNSSISHPALGTLNQYLYENASRNKKPRKNICRFCKEDIKNNDSSSALKSAMSTFALEVKKTVEQTEDENLFKEFLKYIETEGPLSVTYRELLAHIFDVNIRLYIEDGSCKLSPLNNHNPSSERTIYVLSRANKFHPLTIDDEYFRLGEERSMKDNLYAKIIKKTELFKHRQEFDDYMENQLLFNRILEDVTPSHDVDLLEEIEDVKKIIKYFPEGERQQLQELLEVITFQHTKQEGIIHNILRRFSSEGRRVSFQELCCIINSVKSSSIEERNIFCWLVIAYPQRNWIDELIILKLENYFRKPLTEISKLRKDLSIIDNRHILLVFVEKFDKFKPGNGTISIECILDIFYLLSVVSNEATNLPELGLSEWPYALKGKYWSHKLLQLPCCQDCGDLSSLSHYLLGAENNFGTDIVEKLVECLEKRKHELSTNTLTEILFNFHDGKLNLGEAELKTLNSCSHISDWMKIMQKKYTADIKERGIAELVELIKGTANTSKAILENLPIITNSIKHINGRYKISGKLVSTFAEDDVRDWANASSNRKTHKGHIETLAVIVRAIELKRGFRLRDTQMLSVLSLLSNNRSTLAQVSTGEGKSLIVVAASIMKALLREKVHIITSSVVLAKRDAEDNSDIYSLFAINVSHNCSEDIEQRKEAYSGNQVVYGDICNFQRDYLLDRFYGKNILGDHKFENVIVDEVDSMLLDNSNNMLYLSHDLAGFDKLESLYIYIWQWVNMPNKNYGKYPMDAFNKKEIKGKILDDIYGLVKKDDIAKLSSKLSEEQKNMLWNNLIQAEILDGQGKLLIEKVNDDKLTEVLATAPELSKYQNRLSCLLNQCLEREKCIHVPKYLQRFVEQHLETWINSAISAFLMNANQDYVVDVDRTGTGLDRNANIIILDIDTGTDQANSQWDDALHQFLQLKHGCKLSLQSLKSVFISNVSYFKLYDHLYGLSGTLGSHRERDLLQEIHAVDFVTIPTAKSKQFYEDKPITCRSEKEWITQIHDNAIKMTRNLKRSVLIICETVSVVETLYKAFGGKVAKHVHTYTRDFEEFEIAQGNQELQPGQIIIATNLAGRGTDIKITKELREVGGLHVCLTFLPNNMRIERQAFGRAARCGDKGSGRLIIMDSEEEEMENGDSKIFRLKEKRDTNEIHRLSNIKAHYEMQITMEEKCFTAFKDQYKQLKLRLEKSEVSSQVKEILLQSSLDRWAFWLDENCKHLMDLTDEQKRRNFNAQLDQFMSQFEFVKPEDITSWLNLVDGHIFQMIKLGKYFYQKNEHDQAVNIFDEVIKQESHFSEAAHYYKAFVLFKKIDFSKTPLKEDDKLTMKIFKNELRETARLLDQHIQFSYIASGVISQIKKTNNESMIRNDAYVEQQQHLIEFYNVFQWSISDILGHSISPQSFVSSNITEGLAIDLFDELVSKAILRKPKVKKNISEEALKAISIRYGMSVQTIKDCLSNYKGKEIDPFEFPKLIRTEVSLPSSEEFWKLLIEQRVFNEDVKYVLVDKEKLKKINRPEFDIITEEINMNNLTTNTLELNDTHNIILKSEVGEHMANSHFIFKKNDFKRARGFNIYKQLKRYGVLSFNRTARVDPSKIDSVILPKYDCITLEDFTNKLNLPEGESSEILAELVRQEVLTKKEDIYGLKINCVEIEQLKLPSFEIYEGAVIELLSLCFIYRITLQLITSHLEENSFPIILPLSTKPYHSLVLELMGKQIIKPVTVVRNNVDCPQTVLNKFNLTDEDTVNHIQGILEWSKSSLKCVKNPDRKLKLITEFCEKSDSNLNIIEEVHVFFLNGLDELFFLEEKRWTGIMLLKTTAALALGIWQVYTGIRMVAYKNCLNGLVNIKVAFFAFKSGYFNWNDFSQRNEDIFKDLQNAVFTYFENYLHGQKNNNFGSFFNLKNNLTKNARNEIKFIKSKWKGELLNLGSILIEHFSSNYLTELYKEIAKAVTLNIEEAIEIHSISTSLEEAYMILTEEDMIELSHIVFSEKNCKNKYSPWIIGIKSDILESMQTGNIVHLLFNGYRSFTMRTEITQDILVEFDQKMNNRIQHNSERDINNEVVDQDVNRVISYEVFKANAINQWKLLLREHVGKVIELHIAIPLLQTGIRELLDRVL